MISVQGLSYEEISEHLDVPVGTLKSRVFRARKQLQAWLLGEETADDRPEGAISPSRSENGRRMIASRKREASLEMR
jgi:RNA polymerase sigma-70 factor (ECF subfamily)